MDIKKEIAEHTSAVEQVIEAYLPENNGLQKTVLEAMNYSVLAGGKRLRPMLMQETYRMFGGKSNVIEPFMAAIEFIHTYSLVHDDLPAMDNDEYRRGKKTTHAVYGEAMGILAGDALLNYAFETATRAFELEPQNVNIGKALRVLATKAGIYGMVGGQVLDMQAEEQELTEQGIYDIQRRKTGALIQAACQIGVVAANGTAQQLEAAKTYAQNLGLAFQIRDDMLDVLGDADKLGKATHMDEHKNTFVRLYGIGACSKMIEAETKTAIEALGCFESSEFLVEMARQLALREY